MKKIIFDLSTLKIDSYAKKSMERKWGKGAKERRYHIIMEDLKSFQSAPNGMRWTSEEKASFEKLSYVDKKKYLINKMGFKGGVLFPDLHPDKLYVYPPVRKGDEVSKEYYENGMKALSELKGSFTELDEKKQQEILHYFRIPADKYTLLASKELADLLCQRNFLHDRPNGKEELFEALKHYNALIRAGSPDGYYGYYKLYRFVVDNERFYHTDLTPKILGVNKAMALDCLNIALELGHKEALEDLAYEFEKTYQIYPLSLDVMMTVGYLYQDRGAFVKAMKYANYYITEIVYKMFYMACMKMSIMLGGSLDELIMCYGLRLSSVHNNPIRFEKLKEYAKNRKLIDGLDPYFDELFPPDLVLDFGTEFYGNMYGGSGSYPGVGRWIEDGKMKDPRDKDSTLATVKDFYQKLWQIILWKINYEVTFTEDIREYYFGVDTYTAHLLYRKYPSGFASARPYVFPKEVLDMKIDFDNIPPEDLV